VWWRVKLPSDLFFYFSDRHSAAIHSNNRIYKFNGEPLIEWDVVVSKSSAASIAEVELEALVGSILDYIGVTTLLTPN